MDAYSKAIELLSRRELSTRQLRDRLLRRHFDPDEIDRAIQRLAGDRTLDDRRVAVAAARLEAAVRRRGRWRVLKKVQQLGVSEATARAAVDEVFGELDEAALLDQALARRLRGKLPRDLDRDAAARVVRSLAGQGFDAAAVSARLRRGAKGNRADAEPGEGDE